jgi:hypothetical protein
MARRAMFTGADSIKGMFLQSYQANYSYSLAYAEKGDPCFQYAGDDHEKGEADFEAYIDALDDNGNDDLLYLRFHPLEKKKGQSIPYIDRKTDVIVVTPIRVKKLGEGDIINGVGEVRENSGTWKMYEAVNAIKTLPQAMLERQTAFEEKMLLLLDEPEGPPITGVKIDPTEKYITMAIGALKEPNVIQNIQGLIKMFFPNYQPPQMARPQPAINGINDTQMAEPQTEQQTQTQEVDIDLLNSHLNRLAAHCNLTGDLGKLADLAEQNPQMFQMVLTQLRSLK